ncbi:hypothetical protein HMPREF0322_01117 [Desulfitobacterium hafniense DP7]|uniref:Uncharacterized protein n=1 Tax=Desulfitobacterium hafniense DP7 TaxID=537010 RepID=G9XJI6_DESHA|nr:hypothetical protein HMPREF0322_01117 [Desulfitobacterium hafniense DP7]
MNIGLHGLKAAPWLGIIKAYQNDVKCQEKNLPECLPGHSRRGHTYPAAGNNSTQ